MCVCVCVNTGGLRKHWAPVIWLTDSSELNGREGIHELMAQPTMFHRLKLTPELFAPDFFALAATERGTIVLILILWRAHDTDRSWS